MEKTKRNDDSENLSLRTPAYHPMTNIENYKSHLTVQEIIPLCEQLLPLGIGFAELSAFHAAFFKKIDVENLPYGEALYSLMDGFDTSEKLINAKKQLNDMFKQIQVVSLFWARHMDTIYTLMKLQSLGVTDKEILDIHEFYE